MYDVMFQNRIVGKASVKKQGLYYHIISSCEPQFEGIHRLIMSDRINDIDLGILVPENNCFYLSKRIPLKKFNSTNFEFRIISKDETRELIPVVSGMEFPCLEKVTAARFKITNGQPILMIDQSQVQQDSDPNPKSQNR